MPAQSTFLTYPDTFELLHSIVVIFFLVALVNYYESRRKNTVCIMVDKEGRLALATNKDVGDGDAPRTLTQSLIYILN